MTTLAASGQVCNGISLLPFPRCVSTEKPSCRMLLPSQKVRWWHFWYMALQTNAKQRFTDRRQVSRAAWTLYCPIYSKPNPDPNRCLTIPVTCELSPSLARSTGKKRIQRRVVMSSCYTAYAPGTKSSRCGRIRFVLPHLWGTPPSILSSPRRLSRA